MNSAPPQLWAEKRESVDECCEMFNIRSVSSLILNRKQNFLTKVLEISSNSICAAVPGLAQRELNSLLSS